MPSISLEETHWITSSQSFMDPILYGLPRIEKNANSQCFISREDEFRLLFVIDITSSSYQSPPICPWAPFGRVGIEMCAIEVREHIRGGHRPEYQCWTWLGRDDKRLKNYGSTPPPTPLLRRVFRAFLALLEPSVLLSKDDPSPRSRKSPMAPFIIQLYPDQPLGMHSPGPCRTVRSLRTQSIGNMIGLMGSWMGLRETNCRRCYGIMHMVTSHY